MSRNGDANGVQGTHRPTLNPPNLSVVLKNTSKKTVAKDSNTTNSIISDLPNINMTSIIKTRATDAYHPHSYASNLNNARYENTYVLGPDAGQRFNAMKAERLVTEILYYHLENVKYEVAKCKDLTTVICEEIKARIKSITYRRYKIIVSLSICQNVDTNILIASRALWDTATDNCCNVSFKNSTLHAIATVFAVYYD
jgi:hypothetical protein